MELEDLPDICQSAGIGRQARLRTVCRKAWEFKSPLWHKQVMAGGRVGLRTVWGQPFDVRVLSSVQMVGEKTKPQQWTPQLFEIHKHYMMPLRMTGFLLLVLVR